MEDAVLLEGGARFGPYFVCRVGGLPQAAMDALRAPRTRALLAELEDVARRIASEHEAVSNALFHAVSGQADKRIRNRIIELRRDCFNERVGANRIADVTPLLHETARANVERFIQLLAERAGIAERAEAAYVEETGAARRAFAAAIADESFRKGLLVSSRPLSDNVEKYRHADPDALSGRLEHVERGLLRYFSRMTMKATPFSSFCAVLPGRIAPMDASPQLRLAGDPAPRRGIVRLNKRLYSILLQHLSARATVRVHLPLEVNPTLRDTGRDLLFLASLNGHEVFQRLSNRDVVLTLVEILRRYGTLAAAPLAAALSEDPDVDASTDEAAAYVEQLISIGLLRFRLGIAEQNPDWDAPFGALLDTIDDPHARVAADALRALRASVVQYEHAPAAERPAIMGAMWNTVESMFVTFGLPGAAALGDLIVYEDSSADSWAEAQPAPLRPALNTLAGLMAHLRRLSWTRSEQATMRHFFATRYRDNDGDQPGATAVGKRIPLLQFYEDFYRDHFKQHLERVHGPANRASPEPAEPYDVTNPFKLPFVTRLLDAQKAVIKVMTDAWTANPDAEEVHVASETIAAIGDQVDPRPTEGCSASVFAQVLPPSSSDAPSRLLVLNGFYHAGFGKYFSRFLYLFDARVTHALRTQNAALTPDLLAEISGDSYFNANLHPRLLAWDIAYPTGETGQSNAQLLSADLDVTPAPDDEHALILVHRPTGRRVHAIDLGFLNTRMRPPLFQLLNQFGANFGFGLGVPEAPASAAPTTPRILVRPRFVYGGTLVLSRRRWTVSASLFPVRRQRDESPWQYFRRVNTWRTAHGIPERVYVRVRPLPSRQATANAAQPPAEAADGAAHVEEAMERHGVAERPAGQDDVVEAAESPAPKPAGAAAPLRYSRDFLKPQYIDFSSPLLVRVFEKITGSMDQFVVHIEEELPGPADAIRWGEQPYAYELLLQLDFPVAQSVAAEKTTHSAETAAV